MDHFERKAVPLVDWSIGIEVRKSSTLFDPQDKDFPQPASSKRLNYELWNGAGDEGAKEKVWLKARQLAAELDQKKPIEEVQAELEKLLTEYRQLGPASKISTEDSSCLVHLLKEMHFN